MNFFCVSGKKMYRMVYNTFSYNKLIALSKMLSHKNRNIIILGLIPVIPSVSAQSVVDRNEINKLTSHTNKDVLKEESSNSPRPNLQTIEDEKTPWERVKAIYEKDEFGNYSKEMITTLHCCYMSLLVGFIYGGVQRSRVAFVDYMERNQATLFDNHLDAKRKLQNHVTIHFGKGALQWAFRLTAFTGGFVLTFLSLHAYRGTTSIIDYTLSGALVGALLRIKLGPPGIIIGGAVGGTLGLFCGFANQSILSLFNVSFDEVLSLQYKIDHDRNKIMEELAAKEVEEGSVIPKPMMEMLKAKENKFDEV